MEILDIKITGTRPLLMHSDLFVDPLNPLTKAHKALTSKRKKTDDDHELIARSEWRGGLYYDEKEGPYMPGVNFESSLVAGAKLFKLGAQIKRSCEIMDDICRLEYEGPRDVEGLWNAGFYDARSVVVQRAKLVRYRPLFRIWSTQCQIAFDEQTINKEEIIQCFEAAGQFCGVGDFRPKFGRFRIEI